MPSKQIAEVAEVLVNGGIRLMKITFDHSNEDCIEDTIYKIIICKDQMGKQFA